MFRTLVKTDDVAVGARTYPVRYFEQQTDRGSRRFAAEILLGAGDRIILDDDSIANLEARTARLVPATSTAGGWRGCRRPEKGARRGRAAARCRRRALVRAGSSGELGVSHASGLAARTGLLLAVRPHP